MKALNPIFLVGIVAVVLFCFTACGAAPAGVTIEPSAVLVKGETAQLQAEVTFDQELDEQAHAAAMKRLTVSYISSDESVATVDATGLITAVDGGNAVITATVGTELSATSNVTVTVPVESVDTPKSIDLQTNGEAEKALSAKVLPVNATDKTVTYKSDNEEVATVDATGKVTAVGKGTATITSTASGKAAETTVNVTVKVTGLTLNATSGWIYVGGTHQITPYTAPVEADAATYTFSSDNTKVATVNGNGVITGKAAGTAKITAEGAGHSITYTVTVKTKPAPKPVTQQSGGSKGAAGGTTGGTSGGGAAPAVDVSSAISAGIGYGQSLGGTYVPGCGGNMYGSIIAELSPNIAGDICDALSFAAGMVGGPFYFDITYDGTSVCVWQS